MNKLRLFIVLMFLCNGHMIFGCMCGHSSISEMYENSDAVVVAKAISFKPAVVYEDWIYFEDDNDKNGKKVQEKLSGQDVNIEISKWYKGINRKKLINLSQPNSTCDWSFDNKDLNKPLLLHLRFNKKYETYKIIACGRSTSLKKAADDLSWLNGLPKSLNRTRISGVVQFNDAENLYPRVSGVKIKITGNSKEYNLISDINGLYEIWDLPAGTYSISAEVPKDKKIDWTTSVPNDFTDFWFDDKPDSESLKVTLEPKSTGGIDFMLENK